MTARTYSPPRQTSASGDSSSPAPATLPLPTVARVRTRHRSNFHVGGSAAKSPLSDRDREICATLAPQLERDGLVFVGLDVIGDYLTEVNVTSPTGVQEVNALDGTKIEADMIAWVEEHAPPA